MKVDRISLANFRGFEQLDLSLEEDVTVIAGVNGIGKSSILVTLSAMLSRVLPEFTPSRAKAVPLADTDIRHGAASLLLTGVVKVEDQHCYMSLDRNADDRPEGWHTFWISEREARPDGEKPFDYDAALKNRIRTGELQAGKAEVQEVLQRIKGEPTQPVPVYFSPRRQLPGSPRTLPRPELFARSSAYQFALDDRDVTLREFMHWYRSHNELMIRAAAGEAALAQGRAVVTKVEIERRRREAKEAEERARKRAALLGILNRVISTFIPEFTDLRLQEAPTPRLLITKSGVPLGLDQLSDGERGLLAMLFDITRRLTIANPDLENPVAEGKGIVLIDEIELHLHPKWQREVMRRFTQTFKQCQFIVTSHSPQVLGEVEARCIRFLHLEDGKVVCWPPPHSLGMDSNRVLSELMGVANRNQQTEGELQNLFRRIDEEKFEQAESMIRDLEDKLGHDEPELTRARALIAFLKGGQ